MIVDYIMKVDEYLPIKIKQIGFIICSNQPIIEEEEEHVEDVEEAYT